MKMIVVPVSLRLFKANNLNVKHPNATTKYTQKFKKKKKSFNVRIWDGLVLK